MAKMTKKLSLMFILLIISLVNILPTQVNAANLGDFKDDNESHYYLDAVPDNPEDDFFEEGENDRGFFWFLDATEVAGEQFADIINNFANMAFTFNMFLTELMIAALDLAYEFNFVNVIIDEISDIMTGITGISSSGTFSSSGIFGQLAIFVAVFTVIYAVFMFLFKRSMFQSLGAILQTIICLTIAILLFTNYAPFLKGINQVTTEMSALVLGTEVSGDGTTNNNPNGLDESNLREKMYDNLWTMFVDRPYMYMMYGNTRLSDNLTEERVKLILKAEEGSPERLEALEVEFYEHQNDYITHSKVWQRLSFSPIFISINGITSILIYALALFLILFQFWFMMIAVFAPFALLIGAIPGMFNVTKRYFIELGLPLVLKIVVSFGALIVFSISEILYGMDFQLGEMGALVNSTFGFYMTVVIVHWVLFGLLFFLRKRIANIFVNSTQFMREMKDGIDTTTAPLKSAVQGSATVVGTVGGAMAGGPQGAMMGASIGKKTGETLTGESSVGDFAQTTGKAYMFSQLSKGGGTTPESTTSEIPQLTDESKSNINQFVREKGFEDEDADKIIGSLEKDGIEEVNSENLQQAHESIMEQIEKEGGLKSEYSDMLNSNLKQQHREKFLKEQEEKLRAQHAKDNKEPKDNKVPKASGWMDDSVDMYGDIDEQYENANSQSVNADEKVPEVSSWMSDGVDMYSDDIESTDIINDVDESNRFVQDAPIIAGTIEQTAATKDKEMHTTTGQPNDIVNLNEYEDRKNMASLDLSKQKPAVNDFEYASMDSEGVDLNDSTKDYTNMYAHDGIDYNYEDHTRNDPDNLDSLEKHMPKE